jgi:hypothetical protein
MYGISAIMSVIGITAAVVAFPTGGASVTLSALAMVGSGVATTLSGFSLMGSQIALNTGNKKIAKTLDYTTFGTGVFAMLAFFTSLFTIPSLAATSLTVTTGAETSNVVNSLATISRSSDIIYSTIENTIDNPIEYSVYPIAVPSEVNYQSIESSLSSSTSSYSSGSSVAAVRVSNIAGSSPVVRYIAPSGQLARPSSEISTIASRALPALPSAEVDTAIYAVPGVSSASAAVVNPEPAVQLLNTPINPGAFATEESIYVEMSAANTAFREAAHGNMSTTEFLPGLDHSSYEEAYPNAAH